MNAVRVIEKVDWPAVIESAPVTPANQNTSARTGETAGECPCGWMVLSREKFCGKCGVGLLWPVTFSISD